MTTTQVIALDALETIGEIIQRVHDAKRALELVTSVYQTVTHRRGRPPSPAKIRARLAALRASIADNDAAADQAVRRKFKGKSP